MKRKAERRPDATNKCACGCGGTTARTFAMGHDAKAKSMLLKAERGELKVSDLPRTLRMVKSGAIARMLRRLRA